MDYPYNAHISKQAAKHDIPIFWWPAVDGGTNGAKLQYVQKHYANGFQGYDFIQQGLSLITQELALNV